MATFMGFMMPRDGYGYGTIRIAERLRRRAGVEVVDMQLRGGRFGSPEERRWTAHGPVVALCTPDWLRAIRSPRLVTYTMFEATRLPEGWPEVINGYADGCLVPCRWCADVFRENGIRVPIGVVRWGVEPADYWPIERERGTFGPRNARNGTKDAKREGHEERPYTFLWSGTPDKRKGWDLVYRAFWRAFQGSPDVRLVMHFRALPPGLRGASDGNVELVEGLFDRPRLREMLARADCFVFPSRGEGWGSPPREAAATGLPVIATDWGGLHEEIEEWALPLRVAGMSRAEYGFANWGDIGEWAEPDPEHLVELMRWCFEHQDEAAAVGARAAAWLAANGTWDRTAEGVARVLGVTGGPSSGGRAEPSTNTSRIHEWVGA